MGAPLVKVKSCGDVVMASYDAKSSLQLRVREWDFEVKGFPQRSNENNIAR